MPDFYFFDKKYPYRTKEDEESLEDDFRTKNEDSPAARIKRLDEMQKAVKGAMECVYAGPEYFGIMPKQHEQSDVEDDDEW